MSDTNREITVSLIPKADRALTAIADREAVSRPDAINRALQLYDTLTEAVAAGDRVYLRHEDDTEQEVTWS